MTLWIGLYDIRIYSKTNEGKSVAAKQFIRTLMNNIQNLQVNDFYIAKFVN